MWHGTCRCHKSKSRRSTSEQESTEVQTTTRDERRISLLAECTYTATKKRVLHSSLFNFNFILFSSPHISRPLWMCADIYNRTNPKATFIGLSVQCQLQPKIGAKHTLAGPSKGTPATQKCVTEILGNSISIIFMYNILKKLHIRTEQHSTDVHW